MKHPPNPRDEGVQRRAELQSAALAEARQWPITDPIDLDDWIPEPPED